jgi:hypothetical protein
MSGLKNKIDAVSKLEQKLAVKKMVLVEKAMQSENPSDIIKAVQTSEVLLNRQHSEKKSFIVDPLDFNNNFGYKDKPYSLSYQSLLRMSKTPIINAIIKTRKNQIADFAEPQADRYSTGFVIRKKRRLGEPDRDNTLQEWRRIEQIQNIVLNCGTSNSWHADDFETFIRKIVEDSLVYDQMTFEVVTDRSGKLYEFLATDASTYRIADSYDDDEYFKEDKVQINGYYPSYVQIYQGAVKSEFYPWELCFGIRNPTTNLTNAGYGISELEELIGTVTSLLWADEYNKRFFSQGSAPKGLLRVKGNVNEKQLQAFRQEWTSMITGVQQSWKTPIVDADIDWIDLQKSNRDMEYNSWIEFLIKVSCAVYSIDPNEIGFSINSGSSSSLFESNNEQRLKHSKDKGLYPLLKFIQRKINKYIVERIDPEYEFCFMGLNGLTISEELDIDIRKLSNFQTLNEIRKKYNLEPVPHGDIILNPTYAQQLMMQQQQASMGGGLGMEGEEGNPFLSEDENNPFLNFGGDDEENPFLNFGGDDEENPFLKAFNESLKFRK